MIKVIFEAVVFIKAKAKISLYHTAFGYGFQIFNKFAFIENRGILGWSIILFADWFIQKLLIKSAF